MVKERDPATKPAKKPSYCAECNKAITATQAKNTYSTYDTTRCGECVVDTCATRNEPVPDWNEMPEKLIKGWSESELADWAMRGAELQKTDEDHDVYKIPEPLVPAGATLAGFERVDRNEPDKILRYYKVPKEPQAPTTEAQASEQDQPPHGSLADRMRSQEPQEGETYERENEWTKAAREMRERAEVEKGPSHSRPTEAPGAIQDASYIEVPPEPRTSQPAPATQAQRQVYAPPAGLTYTGPSDLTTEIIQRYINPDLTTREAYEMLMLCKYRQLNPFTREVYAIKYKGKNGNPDKCELVVGKDAFTGRAEQHPAFDGYEAGIIVQLPDGTLERREGTFVIGKETLVGGCAKVYRRDRSKPYVAEVSLQEYKKNTSIWLQIPATMIRKVALVQALREAFPSILGGLYDSAEIEKEGAMIYTG